MAKVTAIGGAATRLSHCIVVLISRISAWSRSTRHVPDPIKTWLDQISRALSIIDDIRACFQFCEQNIDILYLIELCRSDILAMRPHLQISRARGAVRCRYFEAVFANESCMEDLTHACNKVALMVPV
jgi:hypothetical protein